MKEWKRKWKRKLLYGLGNEGMEKNMETTIMGYVGTTIRIHSNGKCSKHVTTHWGGGGEFRVSSLRMQCLGVYHTSA